MLTKLIWVKRVGVRNAKRYDYDVTIDYLDDGPVDVDGVLDEDASKVDSSHLGQGEETLEVDELHSHVLKEDVPIFHFDGCTLLQEEVLLDCVHAIVEVLEFEFLHEADVCGVVLLDGGVDDAQRLAEDGSLIETNFDARTAQTEAIEEVRVRDAQLLVPVGWVQEDASAIATYRTSIETYSLNGHVEEGVGGVDVDAPTHRLRCRSERCVEPLKDRVC
jgi:hypothetical protein